MNLGIVNQFVKTGLSLDRGSLEGGPGVKAFLICYQNTKVTNFMYGVTGMF